MSDEPLRAVAYHLDIATARHRPTSLGTGHCDGALPVARAHVQLLVGQDRRHLELEGELGYVEPPARGIAGAAPRARPRADGLEPYLVEAQGPRAAGGVHDRSRAEAIRVAILPAQPVEHEVATIVELQGDPVPARELGAQRARAPFAVHPGQAGHLEALPARGDDAAGGHARQRVVIGRIAALRA